MIYQMSMHLNNYKLIKDSRIPYSRFDTDSGGGSFTLNAEGVEREEIRFFNFIVRLRSIFQEILISPLYWQMLAEYPSLRGDHNFKSQLGLTFNKLNRFDESKEQEVLTKQIEFVGKMAELKNDEDEKEFPIEWIVKRYMKGISVDDWADLRAFKLKKSGSKENSTPEDSAATTAE